MLLCTCLIVSACCLQRQSLLASTGFRELYCRAVNPARELMLWDVDVRGAPALIMAFRSRMVQLLREVQLLVSACGRVCAGPVSPESRHPESSTMQPS